MDQHMSPEGSEIQAPSIPFQCQSPDILELIAINHEHLLAILSQEFQDIRALISKLQTGPKAAASVPASSNSARDIKAAKEALPPMMPRARTDGPANRAKGSIDFRIFSKAVEDQVLMNQDVKKERRRTQAYAGSPLESPEKILTPDSLDGSNLSKRCYQTVGNNGITEAHSRKDSHLATLAPIIPSNALASSQSSFPEPPEDDPHDLYVLPNSLFVSREEVIPEQDEDVVTVGANKTQLSVASDLVASRMSNVRATPTTVEQQRRALTKHMVNMVAMEEHDDELTTGAAEEAVAKTETGAYAVIGISAWNRCVTNTLESIFSLLFVTVDHGDVEQSCHVSVTHLCRLFSFVCIVMLNLLFLLCSFYRLFVDPVDNALKTDVALALGSCAALSTGFLKRQELAQSRHVLRSCSNRRNFGAQWAQQTSLEALLIFLIWLLSSAMRILLNFQAKHVNLISDILQSVLFVVSSLTLSTISLYVVSASVGMCKMVEGFLGVLILRDVQAATKEWDIVVLGMRKASESVDWIFLTLGSTAVLVVFLCVFDFFHHQTLEVVPTLLAALSIPRVLFAASSASSVCMKLPPLVSTMRPCEAFSENLQLVVFLKESEAGFYVLDTRVTFGLVLKFVYFTCFGTASLFARALIPELF